MKGFLKQFVTFYCFAFCIHPEALSQSRQDIPAGDWPPANHLEKWNVIKTDKETCWYHAKTMYKVCDSDLIIPQQDKAYVRPLKNTVPIQNQQQNDLRTSQVTPRITPPRSKVGNSKIQLPIQTSTKPQPENAMDFFKFLVLIGLVWLVKRTYFKPKAPITVFLRHPNKQKYPRSKSSVLTNGYSELEEEHTKAYSTDKDRNAVQSDRINEDVEKDKDIAVNSLHTIINSLHIRETVHAASPDLASREQWKRPTYDFSWTKDFLNILEWKRFEDMSVELLKHKFPGHKVQSTNIGADGGVDIEIFDASERLIAIGQCKSWKKMVGVEPVRALFGVMASRNIRNGIFLTTSEFSTEAIRFGRENDLALYDGNYIVNQINQLDESSRIKLSQFATSGDFKTPTCVTCNVKMVKRQVKTGIRSGNEFWGCVNYPRCKNNMQITKDISSIERKYF